MHTTDASYGPHAHVFGQDAVRKGENRTGAVLLLTAMMMVIEIIAGAAYGSMALLADGVHMGSHAVALAVTVLGYRFARRYAADARFSFGTGKTNALAGFASAVLLVAFAAVMAWECVGRLLEPVPIAYGHAMIVAAIGLAVNGISAVLLHAADDDHHHGHDHAHDHDHDHDHDHTHAHDVHGAHEHDIHGAHEHDHNLRAAFFHVLADALTSVLAIVALLAGMLFGAPWLDPAIGLFGVVLIARWSWGLIRDTAAVLLDSQSSPHLLEATRRAVEADTDDRVVDLHVWSIGPGIHAAEIIVMSHAPQPADVYRARLPASLNVVHSVIEVRLCSH